VFENRVLRKIFVPRTDEVMRGWKKLHNEELRDLYSSQIYLILPVAPGPRVYSASDRNEYQKQKNNVSGE
jgi:hypothetical protein